MNSLLHMTLVLDSGIMDLSCDIHVEISRLHVYMCSAVEVDGLLFWCEEPGGHRGSRVS